MPYVVYKRRRVYKVWEASVNKRKDLLENKCALCVKGHLGFNLKLDVIFTLWHGIKGSGLKAGEVKVAWSECSVAWWIHTFGTAWYGIVWYSIVWYGICMVWYGMVWYGMIWYDMVWYGVVWYGMVWYGMGYGFMKHLSMEGFWGKVCA